jgi:FAD-linked sulfhydryl oxidase
MSNTTADKPKARTQGMVLGPDGKPCRVCTTFRNWKPPKTTAAMAQPSDGGHKSTLGVMAALAASAGSPSAAAIVPVATPPAECPPDGEQLGRATWTFLHTTAAYYPERPTPYQRANMLGLLRALPILYPCSHCASHLAETMQGHPPDVSGRAGLSRWLCERHNDVNERLGKEVFDCDGVDERWRDGPPDGSCD